MPLLNPPSYARAVWQRLVDAGHETYFCGGCVRDTLLGGKPKDWDLTTNATPGRVEELFAQTVPVGKSFGVMIVVEDGHNLEVATFRKDLPYKDGRRPEGVKYGTAEEDVQRRDFTINALLYDPQADAILDYVGGQADLKHRILRTVGDAVERFREDHLRLLRAVRFAARTRFALEDKTRTAVRQLAPLVKTLSGERVGQELTRMVSEGYSAPAFKLLEETYLLVHTLPEVAAMRGVPQPPEFHPEGDVLAHTYIMLELWDACFDPDGVVRRITAADPPHEKTMPVYAREFSADECAMLGWAILLHDIGKPPTISYSDRIRFNEHDQTGKALAEEVLGRLKRPRILIDGVRELIGRHMQFCHLPEMRKSKRRRWLQLDLYPLHLALHFFDCQSSHQILQTFQYGIDARIEEEQTPPPPTPVLCGKDLIAMGYAPGPRMGEILRAVEDAFLENQIATTAEATTWVAEHFPQHTEPDD